MAETKAGPAIEMAGVNKWFGDFHVLKDIDLSVRAGERVVICGPSGSGKSTVVRCINRLETHQTGRIGQQDDGDQRQPPSHGGHRHRSLLTPSPG